MTVQVHARELAKKQREISVAEFFEKNRHLLGFDNPRKALLTAVKEAVDNSLDACEEARVLPEINVELIKLSEDRFRVIVEDNGPGIVQKQIGRIFGKLLYGSKFHKLAQSRGQQGIGISASALYSQLTTGKPMVIKTKTGQGEQAYLVHLFIDTQTNEPKIVKEEKIDWKSKEHGTKIELDMEGSYLKGRQSVDEYLKETAIVNPHATFIYTNPEAEQIIFARATEDLPKACIEIKPHPYGVELGILQKMLGNTDSRTLQSFLMSDFSRVGAVTAKEICENSALLPNTKPREINRDMTEKLINGIKKTRIMAPSADCIAPIGAELLEKGLKKEVNAEFYTSITRPASVYRGNPFIIEISLAFGGQQEADSPIRLLRFANRVPLLYQPGACAITQSVIQTNWRAYGLQQSRGALPQGPLTLVVHMSSVWVPFTSESKEALAHYPEITKEIKLALQECGRRLGLYVRKKTRIHDQAERANMFEKYIPEVADSLSILSEEKKEDIIAGLQKMIKKPEILQEINLLYEEKDEKDKLALDEDEEHE